MSGAKLKIANAQLQTASAGQRFAHDFLPTVRILRFLGGYPIKIVKPVRYLSIIGFVGEAKPRNTNVTLYEHGSAKDWITWYSLFTTGFLVVCTTALALTVGLESGTALGTPITLRNLNNSAEEFGMNNRFTQYLLICHLTISTILILTARCGSSKFTEWLNGWDAFEILLRENGIQSLEISGHFQSKLGLIIYWSIGMLFTIVTMTFYGKNFNVNPNMLVLAQAVNFVAYVSLLMPAISEDVRTHHMLRMLRIAFQMVRRAWAFDAPGSITMANVDGRRRLTNMAQRQVALAGDCLRGWLSILVINALLGASTGVYNALEFLRKEKSVWAQNGFVFFLSMYSSLPLVMLYFEAQAAEAVYEEERGLCEDILQMREKICEASLVKMELVYLHQRLLAKPASISVGNYFVLDKKLLINVLVQVLTLLITIMQFKE